jgi:hypothetical protein
MRFIRAYFLLCFTLLAPQIIAQPGSKIVVDARTRQPLDYVSIQSNDSKIQLMSNREGKFILIPDAKAVSFTFYRMGYLKQVMTLDKLLAADTVFMRERALELQEVTVSGEKLQPIVRDKRFYVEDYCILPNNDFLLITSKTVANDFELCYYSWDKGIRHSKKIRNEGGAHFVTDCFKHIHLLTDRFSRQVFFDSDSSFQLLPKYNRHTFDSALANCVLRIDTQVIMKQVLPPVPLLLPHFTVNRNAPFMNFMRVSRHAREPFYFVEYNARMREMIESELSEAQQLGDNDYRKECGAILFFEKIAAPIYAPLFLKNDTVVLFDFQQYLIVFLDRAGSVLRQVRMDQEQFITLRDFEILHDAPAQKFYLKMRDADRSFIKRIDIYSGKVDKTIKLEKIFARNIQMANDRIYYLVREKGWDDTQYLYRQN